LHQITLPKSSVKFAVAGSFAIGVTTFREKNTKVLFDKSLGATWEPLRMRPARTLHISVHSVSLALKRGSFSQSLRPWPVLYIFHFLGAQKIIFSEL
jgi:hypothetical protein